MTNHLERLTAVFGFSGFFSFLSFESLSLSVFSFLESGLRLRLWVGAAVALRLALARAAEESVELPELLELELERELDPELELRDELEPLDECELLDELKPQLITSIYINGYFTH